LAFYLGQAPQFETLIVALGRGSDLCHFAARVVRVHQEQRDQGPAYLVGCRFTGRVRL
jgi:hypothetical protein